MIKASVETSSGRRLFVLGLSDMNLQKLRGGQPIMVRLDQLGGPPGHDVMICWGVTEAAIVEDFRKHGLLPAADADADGPAH